MADRTIVFPAHEPGRPGEHDPERPREPDSWSESDEWASDPNGANPVRPGDDPAVLRDHPRDFFVPPQPSTGSQPEMPAKAQKLKERADSMLEVSDGRFKAELEPLKKVWRAQKEKASLCRACLPDYLQDFVTLMEDAIARIEDDDDRTAYRHTFGDFLSQQAELSQALSAWDQKRRDVYDWEALTELQINLNKQLDKHLDTLHKIEAGTSSLGQLAGAINVGRFGLSAVGAELGRQGIELTNRSTIYYGSASEASAEILASSTGQSEMAANLGQTSPKDVLVNQWLKMSELPAPSSVQLAAKWKEALSPVETALSAWTRVAGDAEIGYDELIKKTSMLLECVQLQRTDVSHPNNEVLKGLPDFVKTNAADGLTLLIDEIGKRLTASMQGANMEEQDLLKDLLQRAKKLRGLTAAESLAGEVADMDSADFSKLWTKEKDQVLADLEKDLTNGKDLKKLLKPGFEEGLSDSLKKWRREIKNIPNHNPQALHDATWEIRFVIRRYKSKVDAVLPKKNVRYVAYRTRLLQRLDALQLSMSNQLRQTYQAGYHLF